MNSKPAGFATPISTPEYEVWTSSAQPWDILDPDFPHLEGNFTGEIIKQSLSKSSGT